MGFPAEEKIGEIRRHLAENRQVVLTAPPGSGKTTCVPPALIGEEWLAGRKIVMLEPRRLAARNCAAYMARRMGEAVGETIGYQVRLERKVSKRTRLEIVTEGLLAQRLLGDPEMEDVGLVIFDEFHERSLQCDLAFALALEVRRALRPDLRIMVMSATLDADEIAAHLGDVSVVRAEGRMYPVETKYLGGVSVGAAVTRALKETDGDVLCFLPGEGEIRSALARLEGNLPAGAAAMPLYGALSKEEQDRVFERGARRKVILSTSIAETSVTIEGITAVVDSGLMRVSRFSPASGMSGLVTKPLTQDRAEQRRGRAGRVRAGVCYRLWSEAEQASLARKMMPEILEADLAGLVMTSAAWGALRREDLPWLTMPAASAWEQATGLLKELGALDKDGRLTEKGARMAKLPMHPRLANMILGGGDPILAATLEEGGTSRETDIRRVPRTRRITELARRFESRGGAREGEIGLSEGAQLALAYPDRVAKNRGNGTFRMVNGRGAFLPDDDAMAREPFIVCCELDDRAGDARVLRGCPIAEREVLDIFGERIEEEPYCEWDRQNECVKSVRRGRIGQMTVYEKPMKGAEGSARAMMEGIRQKGVENLPCWTKESRQFRARIEFMRRLDSTWPSIGEGLVGALEGFVDGITRWRELEKVDLFAVMDYMLGESGHDRSELDRLAPTKMEVPSGSNMTIHYEGDEPTVEVRLQECFGLMETPKVGGGKVPIVMTLLSPAQRPIQITKDLAGFWRGAYQLVRKDMRGRYPKHYWPEDPLTAVATRRARPPRQG